MALIKHFLANYMKLNLSIFSTISSRTIAFLALIGLAYSFLFPQYSWAYFSASSIVLDESAWASSSLADVFHNENQDFLATINGNTIIANNLVEISETSAGGPVCPELQKRLVIITAYSSSVEETDSSPFITASGTYVRDGIIAANFLKIGTQDKIPALYGDKIFVVEDRMARKNSHKVDIWMPSKAEALQFGVKKAEIIVLAN
jgi:3D (Asp-Asp-Asp) domain-containing protein